MKKLVAIIIFSLSYSLFAGDFLTIKQKQDVLRRIDMTCADTWCEGDFNFKFKSLSCDDVNRNCVLNMTLFERNANNKKLITVKNTHDFVAKISNAYDGSCTIKNMTQLTDLMTFIRSDYSELNDKLYLPLSDCIETLTNKIKD